MGLVEAVKLSRAAELQRYRTYIESCGHRHATFDQERYYTEMPTGEMMALRDKTVSDLDQSPDFAPQFYGKFVQYLNKKLAQRQSLRDWLWRNTILKVDLAIWRWRHE